MKDGLDVRWQQRLSNYSRALSRLSAAVALARVLTVFTAAVTSAAVFSTVVLARVAMMVFLQDVPAIQRLQGRGAG